jgi:putative ABC transport system permease protein
MNKLSFTIAFRSLLRRPLLSFIKVAGLCVGVSGCVIVFLLIQLELSFDKSHPNGDYIYRVNTTFSGLWEGHNYAVPLPLPDAFRERANGVEAVSQVLTGNFNVEVPEPSGNLKKFPKPNLSAYVDQNYFKVFQGYRWIIGTPAVMDAPNSVVLTESKAKTYFGDTDLTSIIGKQIIYRDSLEYTVAGILADPAHNTDFNFTDWVSLSSAKTGNVKSEYGFEEWGNVNSSWQCMIRLSDGTDIKDINTLLKTMSEESDAKNSPIDGKRTTFTTYVTQPLADIHFNPDFGTWDDGRSPTSIRTIEALGAIALLLLIIAVINFVNLETAQALRRAREVGLRKVMGGSRAGLLTHFISESFVVTSIAVLMSIPVSFVAIISFGEFLPKELTINLGDPLFILFIVGLLIVIPLLSGIYPALALSQFEPAEALRMKGLAGRPGSALMRKVLTVFQFTFSQALISGALIVGFQIAWMINMNLGFAKDNILNVQTPWQEKAAKRLTLRHELEQLSSIATVNQSSRPPAYWGGSSTTLNFNNGKENIPTSVNYNEGDTSYLSLFELKLVAGRNMMPIDSLNEILINETYCKEVGVAPIEMIGKDFTGNGRTFHVVGVLRDFHHSSAHSKIEPWFLRYSSNSRVFSLRLANGVNPHEAIEQITASYKKIYPDQEVTIRFLDDTVQSFYEQERRFAILANTATALAIFISCLGLFGLASFTAIQRTKEIGIRKVLGASANSIMALLSREFLLLVIISFVIAVPIAWYAGSQWLNSFAYRMDLSVWIFLLAGVVSILVAFLTVGFQAAKASVKNPVESLRYE